MAFDLDKPRALDFGTTVRHCTEIAGFSEIREPGCGAVVCQRAPLPSAIKWLAQLPARNLPKDRVVLRPSAIKDHVRFLLPEVSSEEELARNWLVKDIAELAMGFAELMEAPFLRLRLDPITTNACRKFHIDAVTARLVCTYRGQATQYGMGDANREVAEFASVPEACPVILRGTRWPGDAPTGLVHRSPPIEGSGETRLLLVLDPIYQLSEND